MCSFACAQVIQLQIKFVQVYLSELIAHIHHLQKESGGVLDVMGMFDKLKALWQPVSAGELHHTLKKSLEHFPSATARECQACFKRCATALVRKVDAILSKTVKAHAIKAAGCLLSLSPASLQTHNMVSADAMKAIIPSLNVAEWEKYITLPPQVPPPSTTLGCVEWWKTRAGEFPTLAPIAKAFLLTPRSAALSERVFSLLGHNQATVQACHYSIFHLSLLDCTVACGHPNR